MSDYVEWLGRKFKVLNFYGTRWADRSGVYIFTAVGPLGWEPYYIGETISFADRLPTHERWAEAVRLGATHVHAAVVTPEATRVGLQDRLIRAYQPPLNTQGR